MSFLRRAQAPLTERAWHEIDETVSKILRAQLRGRAVVDMAGPAGLATSSVGLGRLEMGADPGPGKLGWGVHRVQPLVETRVSFELDLWELDNVERGARDLELGPAEDAARTIARFEDTAVFNGFAPGAIKGLTEAAGHEHVPLPVEPEGYLDAISRALMTLKDAAIDGPYALVLGRDPYRLYATYSSCYPLKRHVQDLVNGPVHYAPVLAGALLISQRGGDFELTLGQDLAVGFASRTEGKVRLFITESFTFRVFEPEACVWLPLSKSD